eukprot:Blabericola_migrator_1__1018@NODE_1256_length_4964_cov_342_362671_g849_i0_p3_GENE_NODE_1256_length_4964_cov_342_362671_g849_i0NODE_1256_length_4964_cov_342_362671_g849_i0_p3_ORF_typecomplete_len114_score23_62Kdo/PF06293_14/0_16_NODE_1256_length_4964_cov_342_362671_g849_i045484889
MSTTSNIPIPNPLAVASISDISSPQHAQKMGKEVTEAIEQANRLGNWLWDTERYYGYKALPDHAFTSSEQVNEHLIRAIKSKGPMTEAELDDPKLYLSNLQDAIRQQEVTRKL